MVVEMEIIFVFVLFSAPLGCAQKFHCLRMKVNVYDWFSLPNSSIFLQANGTKSCIGRPRSWNGWAQSSSDKKSRSLLHFYWPVRLNLSTGLSTRIYGIFLSRQNNFNRLTCSAMICDLFSHDKTSSIALRAVLCSATCNVWARDPPRHLLVEL